MKLEKCCWTVGSQPSLCKLSPGEHAVCRIPRVVLVGCSAETQRDDWDSIQPSRIVTYGMSLVVQWLRIRLPVQGTGARSLVPEDPT